MDYQNFVKTKRWNDPSEESDGWRLLICRYRPRGLLKANETWDTWWNVLAPSRELHAEAYGKIAEPIPRSEYNVKYLNEMKSKDAARAIRFIAMYVGFGNTVTLLCSSACVDPERCHRRLLKELVLQQVSFDEIERLMGGNK
jgi:uncharacterized protein YeaO (DUF488 family)